MYDFCKNRNKAQQCVLDTFILFKKIRVTIGCYSLNLYICNREFYNLCNGKK